MVWEDQGLYFTLFLNSAVMVVCIIVGYVLHKKKEYHRVLRPNRPESTMGSFWAFPKSLFTANEDEVGEMVGIEGSLYCILLKFTAGLFFMCIIGTIVIVSLCATDTYNNDFNLESDPSDCRAQTEQATCEDKERKIACEFNDLTVFGQVEASGSSSSASDTTTIALFNDTQPCKIKTRAGLFDLSVTNITPQSWRLWLYSIVCLLSSCLCLVVMKYLVDAIAAAIRKAYLNPIWTKSKYSALATVGARTVMIQGYDPASDEALLVDPAAIYRSLVTSMIPNPNKDKEGEDELIEDPSNEFAQFIDPQSVVAPRLPPKKMLDLMEEEKAAIDTLRNDVAAEKNEEDEEKIPLMKRVPPICCKKHEAIPYDEEELAKIRKDLNKCIKKTWKEDFVGSVFVTFDTPIHAFQFAETFTKTHGGLVSKKNAFVCGPREFIVWDNLAVSGASTTIRFILMVALLVVLTFFWGIPVGFLGSLDKMATLPVVGGAFASIVEPIPVTIMGIISAYLPTIVITVFNIVLPSMIRFFSRIGGVKTRTGEDGSALNLFFFFTCMSGIIIQAALQGGLGQAAALISDPTQEAIFNFVIAVVSPSGGYWYCFIIAAGFLACFLKLLLLGPLIVSIIFVKAKLVGDQKSYDALFAQRDIGSAGYVIELARHLFFFAIAMLFHTTVPFLVPFGFFYFCNNYLVERALILDGGKPQPTLSLDFGVVKSYLGVVCTIHSVACFGTVVVCVFKEHTGSIVFAALSFVVSILMQLCMRYHINRLVIPSLDLVMELTDGGNLDLIGPLEPLSVYPHGYLPDYAIHEIDKTIVQKIKDDTYTIDTTWYEQEALEKEAKPLEEEGQDETDKKATPTAVEEDAEPVIAAEDDKKQDDNTAATDDKKEGDNTAAEADQQLADGSPEEQKPAETSPQEYSVNEPIVDSAEKKEEE